MSFEDFDKLESQYPNFANIYAHFVGGDVLRKDHQEELEKIALDLSRRYTHLLPSVLSDLRKILALSEFPLLGFRIAICYSFKDENEAKDWLKMAISILEKYEKHSTHQ